MSFEDLKIEIPESPHKSGGQLRIQIGLESACITSFEAEIIRDEVRADVADIHARLESLSRYLSRVFKRDVLFDVLISTPAEIAERIKP